MKIDRKFFLYTGVTLFLLFLSTQYWPYFTATAGIVFSAAKPLLLGCVVAYLINILMHTYETHFFPNSKKPLLIKSRRIVCMLAAIFTLLGVLLFITGLVIPELISCIKLLTAEIPALLNSLLHFLERNEALLSLIPEDLDDIIASTDFNSLLSNVFKVVSVGVGGVVESVLVTVSTLFSTIVTMLISFIFAIYLLFGKEKLGSQCSRMLKCYLPGHICEKIFLFLRTLHNSFHRFIVGQCVEALILGALCALGMKLIGLPYASMIGTLVGFTALIPIAGAYIGAGVGAFMIMTISPIQAIIFLVYIVILQQLEGNIIYPRVVGSSIGLPGIWVLTAVTIGGGLAGILGMMLGVPLAATAYQLLRMDLHKKEASAR